jgi:hypothetical protein
MTTETRIRPPKQLKATKQNMPFLSLQVAWDTAIIATYRLHWVLSLIFVYTSIQVAF